MVSCQKGPTRHADAWQIGPFWQDILEICIQKDCEREESVPREKIRDGEWKRVKDMMRVGIVFGWITLYSQNSMWLTSITIDTMTLYCEKCCQSIFNEIFTVEKGSIEMAALSQAVVFNSISSWLLQESFSCKWQGYEWWRHTPLWKSAPFSCDVT